MASEQDIARSLVGRFPAEKVDIAAEALAPVLSDSVWLGRLICRDPEIEPICFSRQWTRQGKAIVAIARMSNGDYVALVKNVDLLPGECAYG